MLKIEFGVNPQTEKIYRHPVILKNGQLDEMREAKKRGETGYIRFLAMEQQIREKISARDDLIPHLYVSDKTPAQRVIDYLRLPKKTYRNVEKAKNFYPVPLYCSKGLEKITAAKSLWDLFSSCAKPDRNEVLLYMWRRLETDPDWDQDLPEDLNSENWKDYQAGLQNLFSVTVRVCDLTTFFLEAIRMKVVGKWKEVLTKLSTIKVVERIDDPISFLGFSEEGFSLDSFRGVFQSKVSWEKKLDVISFFLEQTPTFNFANNGNEYLREITSDNPLFESFFALIPKIDRKNIKIEKETLQTVFDHNRYWDVTIILTKLIRNCRVFKEDLRGCFDKKVSYEPKSFEWVFSPNIDVEPHRDNEGNECPDGEKCRKHNRSEEGEGWTADKPLCVHRVGMGDILNLPRKESARLFLAYDPKKYLLSDQIAALREWVSEIPDHLFYQLSAASSSSSS